MNLKYYLLIATTCIFYSNFPVDMEVDGVPVARTQSITEAFLPEALIDATQKGDLAYIQDYYQKNKFDINLKSDSEGMTLLMYGCLHDKPEIVEWLLKMGADSTIMGNKRQLAIDIAADQGNLRIVKLLTEHAPTRKDQYLLLLHNVNNKMFRALEQGNMQEWEKYMKIATYLHAINETGMTPEALYRKAEHERLDHIKVIDLPFPEVIWGIVKSYI